MANQLKTILLLGALSALLVAIGGVIGGSALYLFLAIAVAINIGGFLYSDRIVLRMTRARVLSRGEAPALFRMVEQLAERAELPMPKVAIVPDATPNAFATGRNPRHAVIAVTEGLMQLTDPRELRGVLAHELAHVKNRDTLIATIAAAAATAITYVATMLQWSAIFGGLGSDDDDGGGLGGLLMALLAPVGAAMIQAGISRSREYSADAYAGQLTGDPEGLALALQKLQAQGQRLVQRGAPAPQPVAQSLSIVNPLSSLRTRGTNLYQLFSTHPPIEDRIARLKAMARQMGRRSA